MNEQENTVHAANADLPFCDAFILAARTGPAKCTAGSNTPHRPHKILVTFVKWNMPLSKQAAQGRGLI